MKGKKLLLNLILFFAGLWFFQYFLSYIKGLYTLVFFFIGPFLMLILIIGGVFQLIKLLTENKKDFERLRVSILIFLVVSLPLIKPFGPLDWEKLEKENYLVASMKGTANCSNTLKLKPNHQFKYTSVCFGVDFYFGKYRIKNDTLFLDSAKEMPYLDRTSYAMLMHSENDPEIYTGLCLYQNYKTKSNRCIYMRIESLDLEKLQE